MKPCNRKHSTEIKKIRGKISGNHSGFNLPEAVYCPHIESVRRMGVRGEDNMFTVIFIGWLAVSLGLIVFESGILLRDDLTGGDDI